MNERQTPVRRTVNAGSNPQILDAAYLNADVNLATGTQLFYIDTGLDTLVTTSNPNAGALTTVGALGVNANGFLGFDIATDALGFNIAYASLRVGGVDGLDTIDLGNGSATFVGDIAANQLFGLAAAPAAQAVAISEPGSLALVAAAGLAVWGLRRRGTRVSGDVCCVTAKSSAPSLATGSEAPARLASRPATRCESDFAPIRWPRLRFWATSAKTDACATVRFGQYGARTCSVSVHAACRCIRRAPVRGLKVP